MRAGRGPHQISAPFHNIHLCFAYPACHYPAPIRGRRFQMSGDASATRPLGKRFSHVYLQAGDLLQDSERARRRIAELLESIKDLDGVSRDIAGELGVEPTYGFNSIHWPDTMKYFALKDFLDFFKVACD